MSEEEVKVEFYELRKIFPDFIDVEFEGVEDSEL
jgi:hypothetical protein